MVLRRFAALATVAVVCALGWGAGGRHSVTAGTNDLPREPILRIETGMHIAGISAIGTDAESHYLVTASYDKTIRVWELPSGHPVRVIRPPIDVGDTGEVTAVAVSPDGRTIAGGVRGPHNTVVLFDLQTGRLEKYLNGVDATVFHLAYSRDGRYLAATLFNGALLLYDTSNYMLIGDDTDCADESYGAAFDEQDRLITTCEDGFIREYGVTPNASLRHLVRARAPGGKHPHPVAVSPDGSEIVVGFEDTPRTDVLSSKDLSFVFSPEMPESDELATAGVSWSADGNTLYVGGERLNDGPELIRAWADGGRGAYQEIAASDNTITQILPLRNGGIAFSSYTPSFGIIDSKGHRTVYVGRVTADYRRNRDGFLLSEDGATVQFGYEFGGKALARFSLSERRLDTAPGRGSLNRPIVEGLPITDWVNTSLPKLGGKPLEMEKGDTSRSLAILPDGSGFLLGSEWYLYFFGADGSQRWKVEGPATAWCVNISANGKLATVGFGDGSIRWYRVADGQELLAFFPASDRKRWVVWTPSGYYDASSGGGDLIGWQVNNGRDKSGDFSPVEQFRSTYYRPDIVAKILETGDEAKAILAANGASGRKTSETNVAQMLPPVVEIVSPVDGADVSTSDISVRYALRSPSGETLKDVKILVDGRPAAGERGVAPASMPANGDALEVKVIIPPQDTTVSVIAANRYTTSAPATVHLHWRGANAGDSKLKPILYVLSVGVSQYSDPALQLRYAAKDAQDFAAALLRQKGGLYRDVQVKVLTDDKANKDDVISGLDWIRKKTTSDDVAMVLLSGHGVNDESGKYVFLPHDADMEKLLLTGVSVLDIESTISSLRGKTLFFVDTCHSGNVIGGRKVDRPDVNGLINELASPERGAVVFAASTGTQSSIEDPRWSNGAFTKALVEGLNGKADYGTPGRITVTGLELWIENRVPELTQDQQTPMSQKPGPVTNYTIALKQ